MEEKEVKWQGKTDGTPFMHRALIALCRVLPLEIMYFFMATAIPFYLVFNHKGYISIYHYFRRRMGRGPLWSFFSS